MSDPHDIPGHRKPARAEPIQADRPGRGDKKLPSSDKSSSTPGGAAREQKEQSDTAIDNTREGFDH